MSSFPTFDIFCPLGWVTEESAFGWVVRPILSPATSRSNVLFTATRIPVEVDLANAIAEVDQALMAAAGQVVVAAEEFSDEAVDRHVTFEKDGILLFQYQRCAVLSSKDEREHWFIEIQATGALSQRDELSPSFRAVITKSTVEI